MNQKQTQDITNIILMLTEAVDRMITANEKSIINDNHKLENEGESYETKYSN